MHGRLAVTPPPGAVGPDQLRMVLEQEILPVVRSLTTSVETMDATLRRPAQRSRDSVAHTLQRLIERYNRTLLERDQTTLRRIQRLELALNPEGVPQERYYSWPSLALRHGPLHLKRLVMDKLQQNGAFFTEVQDLEP